MHSLSNKTSVSGIFTNVTKGTIGAIGNLFNPRPMDINNSIKYVNLSVDSLELKEIKVLQAMGYRSEDLAPGQLRHVLPAMILEAKKYISLWAVYRVFNPEKIQLDKAQIQIESKIFNIKKIIGSQLEGLDTAALFICTLGQSFDEWIHSYYKTNDSFSAYIADTIGSELVEMAADQLQSEIAKEAALINWNISNRYSPGYCGWSVNEQHHLFSFFDQNKLAVTLTESALMSPVKSISGIIAIGNNIIKKDYYCNMCDQDNCYKRRI